MKVSVIGVGDMGQDIACHVQAGGHDVIVYDIEPARRQAAADRGLSAADTLAGAAGEADVHLVVVATDAQSENVARELFRSGQAGSTIVIVATNSVTTMQSLAAAAGQGFGFVDAPVCFGRKGAAEGRLASLCGGNPADVTRITPVLECYSRAVHHIGPVGAGQMGKTCNNMLHWAACVANYEALLLAKRYGIDAQHMRETLLECPGRNTTLARWDSTRFTWHEKDMDVALELAQSAGLALPLFGQVDQLVKRLDADHVRELLYEQQASYLGMQVAPMSRSDGGIQ